MLRIVGFLLAALPQAGKDSSYQSDAVRELVRLVAQHNRAVPAELAGYTSRVQTEVALVRVDANRDERMSRVEQIALNVSWRRDGTYLEHAVGHRAQSSGMLTYDALRLQSFTVPLLYGNRLDLLLGPFGTNESSALGAGGNDALHPLADGRERIYRYSRGDTGSTIMFGERKITIGRVHVAPVHVPTRKTTVFEGDLFIDLERHQLVGMRGEIAEIGGDASTLTQIGKAVVRTAGYLEVFSAEVDGRFWLPAFERIELRVGSPLAASEQIRVRFSSRFFDVVADSRSSPVAFGDTLVAKGRRLTTATVDSLGRFAQWRAPLGEQTAGDEFGELAGGQGNETAPPGGPARVRFGTEAWRNSVRYNRVEGLFTGTGIGIHIPTQANHAEVTISGGRAWAEHTWRGEARVEQRGVRRRLGIRAGRYLESTNDFAYPTGQGSLFASLVLSRDDQDYVDRRAASLFAEHAWSGADARVQLELARVRDEQASRNVRFGLFRADSAFRENRPVSAWIGTTATVALAYRPGVLAEGVASGLGAGLRVLHGTGTVAFTRVDVRATARRAIGATLVVGARVDAGMVASPSVPPLQRLFELGGPVLVPDHDYKTIGGDRAVLGRLEGTYLLRSLIANRSSAAIWRRLGYPQMSAALFAGAARSTTPAIGTAARTLQSAGGDCTADGACDRGWQVRASTQIGVRLLDGGVFVGARRRVEAGGKWRTVVAGTFF